MGLPCRLGRQTLPFQGRRQQGRREAGSPGWAAQPPAGGQVLSAFCLLRGSLLGWRPATQSSAAPRVQFMLLQALRRCTWRQGRQSRKGRQRRQRRQRRWLQRGVHLQGPPPLQQVSCRAQLQQKPRWSSLCLASSATAAALSVTGVTVMPRSRSALCFRFWTDVKRMGFAVRFGELTGVVLCRSPGSCSGRPQQTV